MKVLLIEDNPAQSLTLARAFQRKGLTVVTCDDGRRALDRWRSSLPDLVLLDLSLPGVDGLDVLAGARKEGLTSPVIVMTARSEVGDRVLGLNLGADDYLLKPFDLDELEARMRAVARRSALTHPMSNVYLGIAEIDSSGTIRINREVLYLTPREDLMMRSLLAAEGGVVAKERLHRVVFGEQSDADLAAVEVVAYRLRRRLDGTGLELFSLRGLGYGLRRN